MVRSAFRATLERPDGTPILEVPEPAKFTLGWAAPSLAIVYAHQPMRKGVAALIDGLREAETTGVAGRLRAGEPVSVPEAAVEAYRQRLTTPPQVLFPQGRMRDKMLADRRRAVAAWRRADPETRKTRPIVPGHAATWAHEYDDALGDWVLTVHVPRYLDLELTAVVLALVHDPTITPRYHKDLVPRGVDLLRNKVREAVDEKVVATITDGNGLLRADLEIDAGTQGLVNAYRDVLVAQRVFPAPAA